MTANPSSHLKGGCLSFLLHSLNSDTGYFVIHTGDFRFVPGSVCLFVLLLSIIFKPFLGIREVVFHIIPY